LFQVNNTAGARVLAVYATSANKMLVRDNPGDLWTSTASIPLNQWVRWEAYVETGAVGTGKLKFAWYLGDSATPQETYNNTTTANVGTALIASAIYGNVNANAAFTATYWLDDVAVDDTLTDFIGPVQNATPSVTVSGTQNVAAGATVNLTATASDPDGSIASYQWSYVYPTSGGPAITGATTANASLTAPAAGSLLIVKCTVTDDQGATSSATTEVRVADPDDTLPLPMDGGAWTTVGGSSSEGAALADSSDATYLDSGALTATETEQRQRLAPMSVRSALDLTWRLKADTAVTVKLRLYEGTTLRQEWTQALTTAWATYTKSVTNPGAITDWGNLSIAVAASA
jgi:hypothetical protein